MKYLLVAIFLSSFAFAKENLKVETLLTQENDVIWGFDFISPEKIIFTVRNGKFYVFDLKTKKSTEITGAPKVYTENQGGLLDVRVHPKNGYIYFTYSEPVGLNEATTALARAKISGSKLTDFHKLFSAQPASKNDYHFGSRIEFDGKGHLFISVGERGERGSVQKLDNHLGKIIRLNEDGSVPNDNPYVGQKNVKPEIYAYGLRSPQGLMFRPGTQELWEAEMGPQGGDEVNLIEAKKNYGWPVITYGREYHGPKIGEGTAKPTMEQPIVYWVPSISPSAMTFWNNDIYLANLSGAHLRRLVLKGKKVTTQEEYFNDLGWRWRNLRPGPDGKLWFSTDEGKLGRIKK